MLMRMPPILLAAVAILAILLAGCGGPSRPRHMGGVPGGRPYTVHGRTYHPLASARGFVEDGLASWYGPGFHGKSTASGERYDQDAMTAAHKILPLGCRIRVTRADDGRSVVVRVNDRGPFVDGRIIDLSRAAAERLGIVGAGTGRVRIRALDDGESPSPKGPAAAPTPNRSAGTAGSGGSGGHFIRIGAFAGRANADLQAAALRAEGHDARVVPGKNRLWNVLIGPWRDAATARARLEILRARHPQAFVTTGE